VDFICTLLSSLVDSLKVAGLGGFAGGIAAASTALDIGGSFRVAASLRTLDDALALATDVEREGSPFGLSTLTQSGSDDGLNGLDGLAGLGT